MLYVATRKFVADFLERDDFAIFLGAFTTSNFSDFGSACDSLASGTLTGMKGFMEAGIIALNRHNG